MPYTTSFLRSLYDYLEQFYPLSGAFKAEPERSCKLTRIKKNKHILSPIDSNASLYFLVNGLVRGFVRESKKDISQISRGQPNRQKAIGTSLLCCIIKSYPFPDSQSNWQVP
ncbi:hypothetical protein ACUN24_16180 [Pedobacter sp. WC2501]|uniref:hypothetical protein n=1 Tax=Pedobacter sp. WC2501 TaxID=3461400 RepID=UPI00404604BC